jgi:hypothetical protein
MQDKAAVLIDDLISPIEVELHRNWTEEVKITALNFHPRI